MTSSTSPSQPQPHRIRIEGFAPSWAGTNPFGDGFCLGSEDGRVAFTDENGNLTDGPQIVASSGEAINGVAGVGTFLAASTRQEVTVWALPELPGEKAVVARFPQGAHGVLASSMGHFVAPLGHAGVMTVVPTGALESTFRTYCFGDGGLNIYQMYEITAKDRRDLFIAACRSGGVALIDFSASNNEVGLQTGSFPGIDVVDIVLVGTPDHPYAAAAVGIDGQILLFKDIVKHESPILLGPGHFVGPIYRILSAGGHLFVLTSKALYVFGSFADRVARPIFDEIAAPIMTIRMEAIDANICGDRWLVAVMPGEVHRYNIRQIGQKIAAFAVSDWPMSPLTADGWQSLKANSCELQTKAG